ncbi:MAG: hypothetical protein ACYDHY_07260 [Acidiferrobacterales bacterium]
MVDLKVVQVKQFTITLMDEPCSCQKDDVYPDGNEPKWFSDPMQVVLERLKTRGDLYSGLHLYTGFGEDKHVLKIMDGKNKL